VKTLQLKGSGSGEPLTMMGFDSHSGKVLSHFKAKIDSSSIFVLSVEALSVKISSLPNQQAVSRGTS
jgi:hypothetical protein